MGSTQDRRPVILALAQQGTNARRSRWQRRVASAAARFGWHRCQGQVAEDGLARHATME
ncbi:MAG: hypothetical protein ACT4NY_28880 [Pseudonocardiales bacterium]